MEEEFTQCQGPGCTRKVKQASTERGHRARLSCRKNCRMTACRARQRAAEAEAERQRLATLGRTEKEEIHTHFPRLAAESIDLLSQLKNQYGLHMVSVVGVALLRERERATPTSPEPKDLLQANSICRGHQLGFLAICEQGIEYASRAIWLVALHQLHA